MKFFKFLAGALSEADGTPSNNRIMLFLFLTTIAMLVVAVVIAPLFKATLALPNIPPTFETFTEYVTGILVFGAAAGKGINAYKTVKGPSDADKPTEQG